MRKLILALFLSSVATTVYAQHGHYATGYVRPHHHHHHHGHNRWVAPLIVGGVVGYAISQSRPVVVEQPVYVQPPVYIEQPQCSQWVETMLSDGRIVRQRTCNQ